MQVQDEESQENAESQPGEDYGEDLTFTRSQSLLKPLQSLPRPREATRGTFEPKEEIVAGSMGQVAGLATMRGLSGMSGKMAGQVAGMATMRGLSGLSGQMGGQMGGQVASLAPVRGGQRGRPPPQGDTAGEQMRVLP